MTTPSEPADKRKGADGGTPLLHVIARAVAEASTPKCLECKGDCRGDEHGNDDDNCECWITAESVRDALEAASAHAGRNVLAALTEAAEQYDGLAAMAQRWADQTAEHRAVYERRRDGELEIANGIRAASAIVALTATPLVEQATVPGVWRCAKCDLRLVAKTISAAGVGMDTSPQQCPNGCGPMWPETEPTISYETIVSETLAAIDILKPSNGDRLGRCDRCRESPEATTRYIEALREIAKGEGEFSRDPAKHAQNTINNMKSLAVEALCRGSHDWESVGDGQVQCAHCGTWRDPHDLGDDE